MLGRITMNSPIQYCLRQVTAGMVLLLLITGAAFGILPNRSTTPNGPCATAEKQLFLALSSYAADNDDFYPPYDLFPPYARGGGDQTTRWKDSLLAYASSPKIFFCPSDLYQGKVATIDFTIEDHRDTSFTYIAVSHYSKNVADAPLRFSPSFVPVPNKTMLLQDPLWVNPRDRSKLTMSHGATNNVLLFDGSVLALTANPYFCGWTEEQDCLPL